MRMVECLLCPDFVCNVKNISTWFNTQRRPFRQFKALYRLPLRTCPGAPWIILYPASSPSFTSNKLLHLAKALPVFILLWLWFLLLRFFFDAQRDFWIFIYLKFFFLTWKLSSCAGHFTSFRLRCGSSEATLRSIYKITWLHLVIIIFYFLWK